MVSLLAGSIPDLKFHRRIINRYRLREERSSDRRFLIIEQTDNLIKP